MTSTDFLTDCTAWHWLVGSVAVMVISFFLLVHDPSVSLATSVRRVVRPSQWRGLVYGYDAIVGAEDDNDDALLLLSMRALVAPREFCRVRATVYWRRPWTSERAPSRSAAATHERIVPFANQVLFVRAGGQHWPSQPVYTTIVTDAHGRFATRLPRGAVFALVTREKGEARDHAFVHAAHRDALMRDTDGDVASSAAERRRVWMRSPALRVDTRACTPAERTFDADAGSPADVEPLALVEGGVWPRDADIAVPVRSGDAQSELELELGGAVFVVDQRDPTLPPTHSRDATSAGIV